MAERQINLTIVVDDKGTVKRTTKDIKTLNQAVDKVQGTGNRASKAVNETKRNLEGVSQRANNAGKDFSRMAQGMGGLVQAYATVAANVFALSSAFRVLQLSADLSSALISARDLTAITGRNFKDLASSIQAATGQALNFEQSVTAANRAAATGASNEQINQLATLAAKAAQTFGGTTTDALNRFTDAVLRGRTELVSKIGIVIDAERATENYAAGLGKSAQDLTEFEKKQALTNAILEQGQKILGDVTLDPNPYEQVTRAFQDLGFQALETIRILGGFDKVAKLLVEMRELVVLFAAVIVKAIAGRALPAVGLLGQSLIEASKKSSVAAAAAAKAARANAQAIIQERSKLTTLNRAQLEKELNAFTKMQQERVVTHRSFTKKILDQEKKLNTGVLVERRNALARELKLRAQGGKSLRAFEGIPTEDIDKQLRATNALISRETTTQTRLVSQANEKIAASTSSAWSRMSATVKAATTNINRQVQGFKANVISSFADVSTSVARGSGFLGLSAGIEILTKRMRAASIATASMSTATQVLTRGTTLAAGAVGLLSGVLSKLIGFLTGPIGIILVLFGPTLWEKAQILIGQTTKELSSLEKQLKDNADILKKNDTTFENYAKRLEQLDITKIEDLTTKFEFQANALDDLLGQIKDLDQIITNISPLGLNIEASQQRLADLSGALAELKRETPGNLLDEEGNVRSRFARTFIGRGGDTASAVREQIKTQENQINALREQLPAIAEQYGSALAEAARLGGTRGIKLLENTFKDASPEVQEVFSNVISTGINNGLSNTKIVELLNEKLKDLPNNVRDQLLQALQGLDRAELEDIIGDTRVLAGATQSVADFTDEYRKLIQQIEQKNISDKSLFNAFTTLGSSLTTELQAFSEGLRRGDATQGADALRASLAQVPKTLLEAAEVTKDIADLNENEVRDAAVSVNHVLQRNLEIIKLSALRTGELKAQKESAKIQEQISTSLIERAGSLQEVRSLARDISEQQAIQLQKDVQLQAEKVRQLEASEDLKSTREDIKGQALATLAAERLRLRQLEQQQASYDKIYEARQRVLAFEVALLDIQKETVGLQAESLDRVIDENDLLGRVLASRTRELEIEKNLADFEVKRLKLQEEINKFGASSQIGQALQKQLDILNRIVEQERARVGLSQQLQAQLISSDLASQGIKLQAEFIDAATENARDFLTISKLQVVEQRNQLALREQELRQTELNIERIIEERNEALIKSKDDLSVQEQIRRTTDVQIQQERLRARIARERLETIRRELQLQETIAQSREVWETTAFGGIFTEEGFRRFGIILGNEASESLLKGLRSTPEVFAEHAIKGAADMADSFSQTLAESGSFSNAFEAAGESIKKAIRDAFAENLANRIKQIIGTAIVGPEENPIETRIENANTTMQMLDNSLNSLNNSVDRLIETMGGTAPEREEEAQKRTADKVAEVKSATEKLVEVNEKGFEGLDSTLVSFLSKLLSSGASKTGDFLSGLFKAGVSLFTGGTGGTSSGGSAGLPKLAATGGVATSPTIISEYGQPEAAVPLPNGKEIPVKMEGGSSNVTIQQKFDFRKADPSTVSQLRAQSKLIEDRAFRRVFSEINKGGRYAKAVGRRR